MTGVIPERVEAIVASASPLLDGVRWAERSDIWVGAAPGHPRWPRTDR